MKRMDVTKISNQLVMAGLVGMVENDGLTPHEAFEVLEDIKRQTWHALTQIKREGESA
jgi:hypothetical protein